MCRTETINDQPPNFRTKDGRLFLVRCYSCKEGSGRENWAPGVATGQCAWCGWKDKPADDVPDSD